VDLAEDLLSVVDRVDFVFFPVAMDFKKEDVENLGNGEIDVCFINGAIRTSEEEEMARLLRAKSQILIAYGSCSCLGGIPGLANLFPREEILQFNYLDGPSVVNPDAIVPKEETKVPEGEVELPSFHDDVKTLAQTVEVDYFLPGCPPPVILLKGALEAILEGNLPEKGQVLAPDIALCDECPRKTSKPERLRIDSFRRPHEILADPETCLLAQGLLCLGPVTRGGCGAACVSGNMPCTGCLGPVSRVRDYGGKAVSAIASLLDAENEEEIVRLLGDIVDPPGTFYRYGLPASLLHKRILQ